MPVAEAGSLVDLAINGRRVPSGGLPPETASAILRTQDRVPNRSQVKRRLADRLVMPRAEGLTVYGEGIDFSTTPNFGCVRNAGRNFVCMYIKWVGRATCEAARSAGLRVIPIYETTGVDYRGGYPAGVAAARAADAWCNANGYAGTPIYMTYDTDVLGVGQYGLAAAYADGWRDTLGRGRVGGYGQNGLVTRLFAEGHIGWVWVTYAWSGGALGPEPIHCYQNPNDITVCGVNADRDRTFTPTMGAIGEGAGPGPGPGPQPIEEDDMNFETRLEPGQYDELPLPIMAKGNIIVNVDGSGWGIPGTVVRIAEGGPSSAAPNTDWVPVFGHPNDPGLGPDPFVSYLPAHTYYLQSRGLGGMLVVENLADGTHGTTPGRWPHSVVHVSVNWKV